MNVIIDSSEFIADIMLRSPNYQTLQDYLLKTGHKLIVPRVVHLEVLKHYRTKLVKEMKKLKSARDEIQKLVPSFNFEQEEIAIDDQVQEYSEQFFKLLGIKESDLVAEKDSWLPSLINRAVGKVLPCTEQKENFRDSIVWLTLLDQAKHGQKVEVGFISRNTREFGGNAVLLSDLASEAESYQISVKYFNKIFDFCSAVAEKITFINLDWIERILPKSEIKRHVLTSVSSYEKYGVQREIDRRSHERAFDDAIDFVATSIEVDDYYVKELSNGNYQVVVLLSLSISVDLFEHTLSWSGQPAFESVTEEIAGSMEFLFVTDGDEVLEEEFGDPELDYNSIADWYPGDSWR